MSVTATVAKITATLAKDENGRKVLKTVLGIILGIVVVIIGVFFMIASALSNGAQMIFGWVFGGENMTSDIPLDLQTTVRKMQTCFAQIDDAVIPVNNRLGYDKVDARWVKAVYYTIYFNQPHLQDDFFPAFVECFVTTDEAGNEIPQKDNTMLAASLEELCGKKIDNTMMEQAKGIHVQMIKLSETG